MKLGWGKAWAEVSLDQVFSSVGSIFYMSIPLWVMVIFVIGFYFYAYRQCLHMWRLKNSIQIIRQYLDVLGATYYRGGGTIELDIRERNKILDKDQWQIQLGWKDVSNEESGKPKWNNPFSW